jgi:hypothetical protein
VVWEVGGRDTGAETEPTVHPPESSTDQLRSQGFEKACTSNAAGKSLTQVNSQHVKSTSVLYMNWGLSDGGFGPR